MTRQYERFKPTVALAGLSILLSAPVLAAEPDYRATTVEPVNGKKMVGETFWRCVDGRCTAQQVPGARQHVCSKLAREVGRIESFVFRGAALDAAALADCNSKVR